MRKGCLLDLCSGVARGACVKNELLDNIENPYSSQNLDQIFVKTPFDINMLFLSLKICDGVPKCIATPQMNRKKEDDDDSYNCMNVDFDRYVVAGIFSQDALDKVAEEEELG